MLEHARSTLAREAKGPVAAPPVLKGELQAVADAVGAWPQVSATTHAAWSRSSAGAIALAQARMRRARASATAR